MFNINFWKYILLKPKEGVGYINTIICRLRKHPCGVIWYNIYSNEPDMHCKNCYDWLG